MEVRPLQAADRAGAARIITDALLHDPGWLAVGPRHATHRRFVALRFHRAVFGIVERYGGPSYGAYENGRLAGVAITFAAGLYPPPRHTEVRYAPAFMAAGPGPIVRGLRTQAAQDSGHPEDEHVYLWFLAVDPAHQRAGLGRALLARVCKDAEAPVYLDTTNPANVPYYASNGFEEIGTADLPRDTTMWFMRRP